MHGSGRPPLLALLLVMLAGGACSLAAQCLPSTIPPEEAPACKEHYPTWAGELAAFGANAVLGAISGGIMQELKGGSFRQGFTRGFAGGSVIYLGKRLAVERFEAAGLVGRQVAAVGGSMVRNAGEGAGVLEKLYLPVGVGRLEVRPRAGKLQFTPDLTAIGWTVWAMTQAELTIDRAASLSAGALVFRTDNQVLRQHGDTLTSSGITNSGVIYIVGIPALGPVVARKQLAHERVHVLQQDQLFLTVTDPVEELLLRQLPFAGRYATRVDVNLSTELLRRLARWFPKHLERPWETEAIFFSR
ncbi:MAG: hypothetical protein FIB01_10215 [Gemmatimonadetes bacterium]|nr:hypothetical protein [Gemmatimonadota bacterium]